MVYLVLAWMQKHQKMSYIAKDLTQIQEARSRLLLVTNGSLEGIISATNIVNWLQRQQALEMQSS